MFVSGLRDEPAEMAEARRSPASANDGQITPQARDTWGGRHPLLRRAACRQPPAAAPMRASLAAAIGRKWPLFSNCGGAAAAAAADQCFNDFRSSSSEGERKREEKRGSQVVSLSRQGATVKRRRGRGSAQSTFQKTWLPRRRRLLGAIFAPSWPVLFSLTRARSEVAGADRRFA